MRKYRSRTRRIALMAIPVALLMAIPTAAGATGQPYETVVSGLRNPRGVGVAANGQLYVAEAGDAGDTCFPDIVTEEGGPLCGGLSARVSRVDASTKTRYDYINGLVSIGGPLFAIGASGLAVQGNQVTALMGANDIAVPPAELCGAGPACKRLIAAARAQLGHVLQGATSGQWGWKQDVGHFNFEWTVKNKDTIGLGDPTYQPGWSVNPDFQPGDANPYGMAGTAGGTYAVDGGANTLDWIPNNGRPSVVAAFPNPDPAHANAYDSVPTCVTPAGANVFVSDLNGQIFVVDGSSITVHPAAVTSNDGSFLASSGGCAYDGRGSVYVSDIFVGSVVKIALNTMTMSWVVPPGTLNFPSGVAIGRHGALYVANNSVCPDFPTPVDPNNPCGGVTGSIVRLHI